MRSKPSNAAANQVLAISPKRAETLLLDWANIPGEWPLIQNEERYGMTDKAVERLRSRYPEVFPNSYVIGIVVLRDLLRKAWDARNDGDREWYTFVFRYLAHQMARRLQETVSPDAERPRPLPFIIPTTLDEAAQFAKSLTEPPAKDPLDQVGSHFQNLSKRAKHCINPDCVAPYFLSEKKGQKYCSDACCVPALRAAKLRWWDTNRKGKPRKTKRRKA
jgi:hypothetical protein